MINLDRALDFDYLTIYMEGQIIVFDGLFYKSIPHVSHIFEGIEYMRDFSVMSYPDENPDKWEIRVRGK